MYKNEPTLDFESATGQGLIKPLIYLPANSRKSLGIVLIIHGMAEHQLRYQGFAEYLAAQDFAVCTIDLPGHGHMVPEEKYLGFFAAEDPQEKVLKDIEMLTHRLADYFNNLPLFILGHSMGSLIARVFCARTSVKLAGAVFSGTVAPNGLAGIASWLARRSIRKNGDFYRDKKLDHLMNKDFQKRLPAALSPFDWISNDQEIVRKYLEDPLCGFVFTANGFYTLFSWVKQVQGKKWAAGIPADLPVFIFSGEQDPVGGYGKGVKIVAKWLDETGHQTDLRLYKGGRHEMLNELDRDKVWADVANWLKEHVKTD